MVEVYLLSSNSRPDICVLVVVALLVFGIAHVSLEDTMLLTEKVRHLHTQQHVIRVLVGGDVAMPSACVLHNAVCTVAMSSFSFWCLRCC